MTDNTVNFVVILSRSEKLVSYKVHYIPQLVSRKWDAFDQCEGVIMYFNKSIIAVAIDISSLAMGSTLSYVRACVCCISFQYLYRKL